MSIEVLESKRYKTEIYVVRSLFLIPCSFFALCNPSSTPLFNVILPSHSFVVDTSLFKMSKFSKVGPNIKLNTILDADGNEINVERREDKEEEKSRKAIFDLLLSAGYFRIMIKSLSDFDKVDKLMFLLIDTA